MNRKRNTGRNSITRGNIVVKITPILLSLAFASCAQRNNLSQEDNAQKDEIEQVVDDQNYETDSSFLAELNEKGLFPFEQNGKELIKSSFSVIKIPIGTCSYEPLYANGYMGVRFKYADEEYERRAFINDKGEFFDFSIYDDAYPLSKELFRVAENEKHGIVNKAGKIKVPIIYDGISDDAYTTKDNNTIIKVCKGCVPTDNGYGVSLYPIGGKHGIIDENGKIIVPLNYEYIYETNNVAFFNKGGKVKMTEDGSGYPNTIISGGAWEMYNFETNSYSKTNYKSFRQLNSNLTAVSNKEQSQDYEETQIRKWGVIDANGKEILPVKYDDVYVPYDYDNNTQEHKIIAIIGNIEETYTLEGKFISKKKKKD